MIFRVVRFLAWFLVWLVAIGCAAWALGALAFDFPDRSLRRFVSIGFALVIVASLIFLPGRGRKLGAVALCFVAVLAWWLTLKPSNDRQWQPDVAKTGWAKIQGDTVMVHNVRDCNYQSETLYAPQWSTRLVRLSEITGIDMAFNYWGSPWMAHPVVSFTFERQPPLSFSIETRKEVGESYSAIGGIYRQYELVYIAATERDVLGVRTIFRKGEDVFLYRLTITPEQARARFLEYVNTMNELNDRPRWYNAVTTNCTTSIRSQHPAARRGAWDWRMLVNGKGDEMMYERRWIQTFGLPFVELKQRSRINDVAKAAGQVPDFSVRIREVWKSAQD
ncbi:MAG TPA: DUF4105 domain-containing protein [Chthoniobacteraceae bacterium]|nr:DUF4105 domain-containing protein [Chthoniobacteraceae bacterium]